MTDVKTAREPLFHISKRDDLPWQKAVGIRAIAIVAAVFVSFVISKIVFGTSIAKFFNSMLVGSFGSMNIFWNFLKSIAFLLCLGVALAPAFKMKFWNIGADGQALMGAVAAWLVKDAFYKSSMPSFLVMLICLIAAILIGTLWAVIPAIFKAKWNTNETLFTLMMNYIAVQIVLYLKATKAKGTTLRDIHIGNLEQGYQYLVTVLIITLVTVAMFFYLKYTKHGYELSLVGESRNTALYAGMNIEKVIIRTVALSGAICGLCGFLLICGQGMDVGLEENIVGGMGFTAIIVCWLAKFNPGYMALTSFFVIFLQNGGSNLYNENTAYGQIIVAIFFFFIIGCEFFIHYKLKMRKKEAKITVTEAGQ